MNKKLYVGNLIYECTDDELKDVFAQAGTVVSAAIIKFRDSGKSKGFGFVELSTEEEAQKALDMFHGQDYKGRKMIVSEAKPPRPRNEYDGSQRGYERRQNDQGGNQGQQM